MIVHLLSNPSNVLSWQSHEIDETHLKKKTLPQLDGQFWDRTELFSQANYSIHNWILSDFAS